MHSLTRLTIPNHVIANFTYHAISCHMSKVIGMSCVHSMDISSCRDVEVFVSIQYFTIIAISDIIAFDYFIVYCIFLLSPFSYLHMIVFYVNIYIYMYLVIFTRRRLDLSLYHIRVCLKITDRS